jgi:hypothetical protein
MAAGVGQKCVCCPPGYKAACPKMHLPPPSGRADKVPPAGFDSLRWVWGCFVCRSVASFCCRGRVVVSLWPFLGWCVTENVPALTACPAGGHFLDRQKVTKERLKGFALKNPTRGFPLDLPADGANAPYPLIPAGLFVFPAGGSPPPACGLRGRR